MIYIKNIDSVDHTYEGHTILAGEYFLIEEFKKAKFASSSELLADIGSGKAQIAKDDSGSKDIADINAQICYLKGIEQLDQDGALMSRLKLVPTGYHYQDIYLTLSMSSGAFICKDRQMADLPYLSVKRYAAGDIEVMGPDYSSVIKTVFTVELPHDVAILGARA